MQVYVRQGKEKRGKWLSPRQAISVTIDAGMLSVPGLGGKSLSAALGDTRAAFPVNDLTAQIQDAVDSPDDGIEDLLGDGVDNRLDEAASSLDIDQQPAFNDNEKHANIHPSDGESASATPVPLHVGVHPNHYNSTADRTLPHAPDGIISASTDDEDEHPPDHGHPNNSNIMSPSFGDQIEVCWPLDGQCYSAEATHITKAGVHVVVFDDTKIRTLHIDDETWRFQDTLAASMDNFDKTLPNSEQHVLREMLSRTGNKSFMLHNAEGCEQFPFTCAYVAEEATPLRTVKRMPRKSVPASANIISSHVVNKIRFSNDQSLMLKASIASLGSEESMREGMRSDCCTCSPVKIQVVLSTASLLQLRIVKLEVKSAFLQTGLVKRQVFGIPPPKSSHRHELGLLPAAAYGPVNANVKWQFKSDHVFRSLARKPAAAIHQLFTKFDVQRKVTLIVIKIVENFVAIGAHFALGTFAHMLDESVHPKTVSPGPGFLCFFGLNVDQFRDYSCSVDGDEKLEAISPYPLSRMRRRQPTDETNAIERPLFMSVNSSLG